MRVAAFGLAMAALLFGVGAALGAEETTELAAGRCAQVRERPEGDVLVNACGTCLAVKIEHTRAVGGTPTIRDYTLGQRSTLALGFKGGGRTRVMGEQPCASSALAPDDREDGQRCVGFHRTKGGPVMLTNSCGLCRQVVVQRLAADGTKSNGTVALDARSTIPVAMSEAVDLQVVTEKACR